MYIPLHVEARFWFGPRTELDSRLSPSPSVLALKIVRQTTKKHLRFIVQHEKELLRRIDPEDASDIYMQLGLGPPGPTAEPTSPEPSDGGTKPYRLGDLEPITVAGLRSHHHPVAQVRAQALATWETMKDEYYQTQQQNAGSDSSWVVQNDNAFSEAAVWSPYEEGPGAEDQPESSTSASASSSASGYGDEYTDDDEDNVDAQWNPHNSDWSDDEDQANVLGKGLFNTFSLRPGVSRWPIKLPTPPPDEASCLPSPVLPGSHTGLITDISNHASSIDSSVMDDSNLRAKNELSQVVGDRKIMEAFLERITRRIKESYKTKSEKEAEKAYSLEKCQDTSLKGQKPRGEGRADSRRALRFRCKSVVSPEQAEHHMPDAIFKARFETHFQMTHHYQDATGRLYTEPVTTEGLPPENSYEWTKKPRKKRIIF